MLWWRVPSWFLVMRTSRKGNLPEWFLQTFPKPSKMIFPEQIELGPCCTDDETMTHLCAFVILSLMFTFICFSKVLILISAPEGSHIIRFSDTKVRHKNPLLFSQYWNWPLVQMYRHSGLISWLCFDSGFLVALPERYCGKSRPVGTSTGWVAILLVLGVRSLETVYRRLWLNVGEGGQEYNG